MPQLLSTVASRVKAKINAAKYVAVTTDAWTSRTTENFVAVTAHFINDEWEFENYTLETKHFPESHTSENLASALQKTVEDWNLSRNGCGPAICTDNASNIVKAVRDVGYTHVGCFAHTLNLATQKGIKLSPVDRLLGRVRRVVTFFHKSTSATSSPKLMQTKLELPEHRLIIDVHNRWNSTYDMCERYLEQQTAVFAALIEIKRTVKDLVTLSEDDVRHMEELVATLKPLKTVTVMMSSAENATISLIHPFKEMILKQMERNENDSKFISDVKAAICNDLQPRCLISLFFKLLNSKLRIVLCQNFETFIIIATKTISKTQQKHYE